MDRFQNKTKIKNIPVVKPTGNIKKIYLLPKIIGVFPFDNNEKISLLLASYVIGSHMTLLYISFKLYNYSYFVNSFVLLLRCFLIVLCLWGSIISVVSSKKVWMNVSERLKNFDIIATTTGLQPKYHHRRICLRSFFDLLFAIPLILFDVLVSWQNEEPRSLAKSVFFAISVFKVISYYKLIVNEMKLMKERFRVLNTNLLEEGRRLSKRLNVFVMAKSPLRQLESLSVDWLDKCNCTDSVSRGLEYITSLHDYMVDTGRSAANLRSTLSFYLTSGCFFLMIVSQYLSFQHILKPMVLSTINHSLWALIMFLFVWDLVSNSVNLTEEVNI